MEELRLSPTDGETFRRVWERVMPDQSLSPIVVREPPLPAVPVGNPPEDHYIEGLERIMDGTRGWQGQWERLAGRQSSKTATQLRTLAAGEVRQLRRLSTLYYLLTGGNYLPQSPKTGELLPIRDSLRRGFLQQGQWEHQYHHMTERLEDTALISMAEELRQGSLAQSLLMGEILEANLPRRR